MIFLFNSTAFSERQLDKSKDFCLIISTENEMTGRMRIQSWIKTATKQTSQKYLFENIKLHFALKMGLLTDAMVKHERYFFFQFTAQTTII